MKELFTKEKSIFVEDDLCSGYAGIFDWNKEFCTVGYNYLKNIDTRQFLRFKFTLKDKSRLQEKSTGIHVFKNHSHNTNMMGIVKFGFNFHFSFYNQGGETKGVRIVLWGPCVEKNMLDVQNLKAAIWMGAIKNNIILELPSYEVDVSGTNDFNEKMHNSGFLLSNETNTRVFTEGNTPEAKHICFWMDVHAFAENMEEHAVKLFEDFIEKIMSLPGSLQSILPTPGNFEKIFLKSWLASKRFSLTKPAVGIYSEWENALRAFFSER